MASGGTLPVITGGYVGTGVAFDVSVGFKPKYVQIVNISDPAIVHHNDMMPDAAFMSQEDGATAYTTSNGITLLDDGFTVGTDAQINTSGDTCHYLAIG